MNIRFQIKKMVRSLQYRVAFLISSLCVCVALLLETWKNRGVDRFAALSASEVVCGYGLSYGSMSVVLIPLLLNMLLCYFIFSNNFNLTWGAYEDNIYEVSLLGENILYSSVNPQYLFLKVYLKSPVLYQLLYFVIFGLFSGICGAFVMAISFIFSGNVMVLFLPIYIICVGTMQLNSLFFAKIINTVNANIPSVDDVGQAMENAEKIKEQTGSYMDLYLMDYFAPMTSSSCSMLYLLAWALVLIVITVILYFCASHRELNAQQG